MITIIWIDNNFYKPDCDENKAFTYLYLLAYMLASKAKYFTNVDDYDGYACHLAYATYKRMKDPDKVPLKSVLNYMKSIMYFRKMSYQQESFAEIIDPVYNTTWNSDLYREKSINAVEASSNTGIQYFINDIIKSIPTLVESSIPNIYKNDKLVYHNLYISSLLSLLSRLTLKTRNENYMRKKMESANLFDDVKYYRNHLNDDAIILWNLSSSMAPVINLILNKVKTQLIKDIKEISSDFKVTEAMFDGLSHDLIFGDTYYEN